MTVNISFEKIKKAGAIALIATNLFATYAALDYVRWRRASKDAFELLEFDINDRLPQIKARVLAKQAEAAQRQADAAKAASVPPPAPVPTPAQASAPAPTKK